MNTSFRNKTIFIVVTVAFALCTVVLFFRIVQWMGYAETDAKIEEIETDGKDNSGNSISIPSHYVIYSYEYSGEKYIVKQKVFSEHGLEKGKIKKIRINPANPKVVFDTYQTISILALEIFFLIFDVLLFFIRKKK